jgi:iron(II)-dependent oxidoreductase
MAATQNVAAVSRESALAHRQLLGRLEAARRQSDTLFSLVRVDALYDRPIPERHRIIFYLGHLEAFDWNLLHGRALGLKSFDPNFDRLFAFGIDPVGGGLPNDVPSDWPSPDVVHEYGSGIRAALDDKLAQETDFLAPRYEGFSLSTLLNVAIEHRLMHVETLSYMLHQLPLDRKLQRAGRPSLVPFATVHRMVEIPEGAVTLGLSRTDGIFGWDNEFEEHAVECPAFAIDQYKVTNRQFAEFIAAGGYTTRAFWSDEDWAWKEAEKITHPVFWKQEGGEWIYRSMLNEIPLPLEWPVYVSQAEASAYARWLGKSLPTEAEWQRAAEPDIERVAEKKISRGEALHGIPEGSDSLRWDPLPVNASKEAQSRFGVFDLYGNGWEWTSTQFAPFPGFEPFSFYRGYSADFFDGKHFVMKGGSPVTDECMLRPTFRNWFQPHYQYVYAGFRCVTRAASK